MPETITGAETSREALQRAFENIISTDPVLQKNLAAALASEVGQRGPDAAGMNWVPLLVWLPLLVVFLILGGFFLHSQSDRNKRPARELSAEDIEAARLAHGFWLVIAGLILTLAVVIVTINGFRVPNGTISDVIAVVTAVSGVVGTLTASFFGIQAAGARHSPVVLDRQTELRLSEPPPTTESGFVSAVSPPLSTDLDVGKVTGLVLDPRSGPHSGGTRVSISGSGLSGASAVNFGAYPGLGLRVVNDGRIQVTSPGVAGIDRAAVSVVYPDGRQARDVGVFRFFSTEYRGSRLCVSGDLEGAIALQIIDSTGSMQELAELAWISERELEVPLSTVVDIPGIQRIALVTEIDGVRNIIVLADYAFANSAAAAPVAGTVAGDNEDDHPDLCDVSVHPDDMTPDEELPAAEGGVSP